MIFRSAVRRERDAREAKERKEVEKLKKELMDVSKRMNNYKNECSELKKGMTQKDLEMKAKDAEIDSLKKAHVGRASKDICSTGMDIDQSLHTPANDTLNDRVSCWTSTTNGNNKELHSSRDGLGLNEAYQTAAPDVLEPKQQTVINNRTSTSGRVSLEDTPQPELKSNNEHLERKKVLINSISSNLCAIWGRPANSMLGRSLISKILVSCSEEMLTLFQSTRLLDKCETSSKASSSMNNAISEVYDIIIKVNNDAMPIRILLEALLNLCVFGNAVVAGRALRMLHNILQNLLSHGTNSNQRNNVSIETYVNNNEMERNSHGGSSTLLNKPDTENLLRSEDGLHTSNMSLPPTFRTSFFNAVLQVALKYSEETIRVHALAIMILIVRTSDPKGDREKIGFTSVMESLHQLLQKENELLVKKHSVHLLFLLLNCPVMLKLLCNGGKGSSELMEAVGFENDRPQQATSSVLKDLSECLTCDATNSLELELCRLVVNLLAYIASSGKSGHTVLLGSVTASGANFLELIMEVLASQMESGVDFSTEVHELLEERYLLMREALILLNRLVSHPIFSKTTLQVLMGSKLCASLTMDIANRLPQRSKYPLRHLSEICPQKANDLAELAQKFCSRVYGYLEEQQHSIADRSK